MRTEPELQCFSLATGAGWIELPPPPEDASERRDTRRDIRRDIRRETNRETRLRSRHLPTPRGRYKSGELGSFRRGLQTLPNAIADRLGPERVMLEHKLTSLAKEDGRYVATFETTSGTRNQGALARARAANSAQVTCVSADSSSTV